MSGFGKFGDGETRNLDSPLIDHPGIMIWAIGLGYEIFVDPSFKRCIYAGVWWEIALRLTVVALLLPALFLVVPFAISSVVANRKTGDLLTYSEWIMQSGWADAYNEHGVVDLHRELNYVLQCREELRDVNHLTDEEMRAQEREYQYRVRFLCDRISSRVGKDDPVYPDWLSWVKDKILAERIWLVGLVAVIAGVAVCCMYFV